jgi:hypothetical protein
MGTINPSFEKIFFNLQNCQRQIHVILQDKTEREIDLPIQKIHEAFALCSGAFYHLNLYQKECQDLFDSSKIIIPHEESWTLFDAVSDLSEFDERTKHPSEVIKTEFRSMCIANAAFRLPSAGALVSSVIYNVKDGQRNNLFNLWPYYQFFNDKNKDWARDCLKITRNDCFNFGERPPHTRHFFLALLVCLRDEYGHSEYHEKYQCRWRNIERYYKEMIVLAEIAFLQDTIEMILQLCQYHDENKIDLLHK